METEAESDTKLIAARLGTSVVDIYSYEMSSERTVYLIDTPGFDDTTKSDTEVLSEIAAWLGNAYQNNIGLTGIIYLHRITDVRMQGSAKKNLLMFRQLCGKDALKRVILATTRWDEVSSEDGAKREQELKDRPEFWGWMLEKGSSCYRHNNTEASARDIVHELAKHNSTIATDLQRQLVDEGRTLDQTSAGRELQIELAREREKWAKERREIEQQMESAILQRDQETEDLLREERDRYTQMIQRVESNTNDLRASIDNLLAKREERIAQLKQEMDNQKDSYELKLKDVENNQRRLEEKLEQVMLQRPTETAQGRPEPPSQFEAASNHGTGHNLVEHTYKFYVAAASCGEGCNGCTVPYDRALKKLSGVKTHKMNIENNTWTLTVVAGLGLSYEAVLTALSKMPTTIYSGFEDGQEKTVIAQGHLAVEWQRRPSTPPDERLAYAFWASDWSGE